VSGESPVLEAENAKGRPKHLLPRAKDSQKSQKGLCVAIELPVGA
jgi:hypothetical protein